MRNILNFLLKYTNMRLQNVRCKNFQQFPKHLLNGSIVQLASISTFLGMFRTFNFFGQENTKAEQYWTTKNILELLDEADVLYEKEKYLEVYEILNRIQFYNNADVQWRICRTLFKMSRDSSYCSRVKENMISEAYSLITRALSLDDQNSEVHKWMAVILDAKTGQDGTAARVKSSLQVKEHMLRSIELNSNDPSVYYMLGYWCYEMTKVTRLQRLIAKVLFHEPPTSSFEEAYNFFLKAEQIRPRFFIGNIHMLGKCCYELGLFYKARYYLKIAADLPAHNDLEKRHSEEAKKLSDKLMEYEVAAFDSLN